MYLISVQCLNCKTWLDVKQDPISDEDWRKSGELYDEVDAEQARAEAKNLRKRLRIRRGKNMEKVAKEHAILDRKRESERKLLSKVSRSSARTSRARLKRRIGAA